MRRVLLVLALVVPNLLLATPAQAHFNCSVSVAKALDQTPNVNFKGSYYCSGGQHSMSVTVTGQRRTPGQAFVDVGEAFNFDTRVGPTTISDHFTIPIDCHKDYRTLVKGDAFGIDPDHAETVASAILVHTC